MQSKNHYKTLQFVKGLVVDVGLKLKQLFVSENINDVDIKDKGDLVTFADKLAEETIIKALQKEYPYYSIFSEESGVSGDGDLVWVVDPLDGTTNFVMRNAFWNVSVALLDKKAGIPILGVVFAPMYDALYWALWQHGAYKNGKRLKIKPPSTELHAFCYGDNLTDRARAADYYKNCLLAKKQCRQLGSAQLELAYVAEGTLSSMFIAGANVYDVLAGVLLVKEAGGIVLDEKQIPWRYDQETRKDVWASYDREVIKQQIKLVPMKEE